MKKSLIAALLCLCLLTGMFTTAAYAAETLEGENSGGLVNDGASAGGGELEEISPDAPVVMPSTGSGNSVIADTIEGTTGGNYDQFEKDAKIAYSKGIDIYAQAFDSAVANATHVYKVEIVWGDMAFAWGATDNITRTWNPNDHSYDDDTDTREKKWYLLNENTPLAGLEYDKDGSYAGVLSGTDQNYVLMFNHSDQPVNANVKITEIYGGQEDTAATDSDNIIAALSPVDGFGTTATSAADGSFDYQLSYDDQTGVIYSKENGTAAAISVGLNGEPNEGVLNEQTDTTVALITITLSTTQENAPDIDQSGTGA